jgi:hypothetical protein
MVNGFIAFVVFGIIAFLTHVISGGDFVRGLSAKKDNKTDIAVEPLFTGKSIAANLKIKNNNDFDITDMRMRCVITNRNGVNQKRITKPLDGVVKANSEAEIKGAKITIVDDFPGKMECFIVGFNKAN